MASKMRTAKTNQGKKDSGPYLHGFSKKEQARLLHQADFLEPYVYRGIDLEFTDSLLEVGCGVGAQTQILLRRFPKLQIKSVDLSTDQLNLAQRILAKSIREGRVSLEQQDGQNLKLAKKDFDTAFLCWFLEHVPEPAKVMATVMNHLKPGGRIYCTEVFNQTLFVEPYSPAFLKYWFEFNNLQWEIKGHPFVGASLGNLLLNAGFHDIQTEIRSFHFDSRQPEIRAAFTDYFHDILVSAEASLLERKRVDKFLIREMAAEFDRVKKAKDSVFFYSYVRATAVKPQKRK